MRRWQVVLDWAFLVNLFWSSFCGGGMMILLVPVQYPALLTGETKPAQVPIQTRSRNIHTGQGGEEEEAM